MDYANRIKSLFEDIRTDDVASHTLGLLDECAMDSSYNYRGSETFEEKLRRAVGIIKQAIIDEAVVDAEDDGERLDYRKGEETLWLAVERVLGTEVNVNKFKALLPIAKAKVQEFKK